MTQKSKERRNVPNKGNLNVPNLRFPGFEREWENKKLGEVAEINPSNQKLPSKFIYIDLESVVNGKLIKEQEIDLDEAPSRAQRLLEENDVLFQMVRPYQKNNLFFEKIGHYVASTGYALLKIKEGPRFVYHYLHYQKFVDKVIKRCTGTSYPAINSTDFSNIKVSIPSLPEQKKIESILSLLEKRIHVQSQIIEDYKLLKKGLLQKIFKQDLRFKNNPVLNDFRRS